MGVAAPGPGALRTRRWNDPPEPGDGLRVLVCRYRPRGVRHGDETWDEWWKELGPSPALHAAFYGRDGAPIDLATYRRRYLAELADDPGRFYLRALRERLAAGEPITLLCSSACIDEARCHRAILRDLVGGGGGLR
jgi:uncharacterized protein YeaO (DUF488 family)